MSVPNSASGKKSETERRKVVDWEAIEREYRAGQFSVLEIGHQNGVSHTAINKRAKKLGWTRNLAAKVRKEVSARLVSAEVSIETERSAVELAAERGVQVIREHRVSISRGQKLANALFGELEEASEYRDEIEKAIEDETKEDKSAERRNRMFRAVALPSRSGVLGNLATALKTLVGLERQAFGLDEENSDETSGRRSASELTEELLVSIALSGR